MSKQIIIVKPKTLSAKDKEKLTKAGHVVVEHQWPENVRIISEGEIQAGPTLLAALKAIRQADAYGAYRVLLDGMIGSIKPTP